MNSVQTLAEMNTSAKLVDPDQKNAAFEALLGKTTAIELTQKSLHGGVITVAAQGLTFVLQTGAMIGLARLLSPADFGLQGMVVAMTGLLGLFRDGGLGAASVQRRVLTHDQTSTLFWINVAVGTFLTLGTMVMAPLLVAFYKEPRLLAVTVVSASAFLFNGLAVQHRALLYRASRFTTVAKIDFFALAASAAIGVSMAALGCGYWALVGMAVSGPLFTAGAVWTAMPWLPGRPTRGSGIRSMLHFGGVLTLNMVVVYFAYNIDKMLLGRFWGAEALGLYGRAYQLANLPVQQFYMAVSNVALPALSRAQDDAERLRRSFLKAYSVVLSVTVPITITCAVFAEEIVGVLLGSKWIGTADLLRFLAPTVLGFALVNPFGWFLMATGRINRSLNISFLIAPVVMLGIAAGLRYGPLGVALGFSAAMVVLVVPIIAWATYGTGMTASDCWHAISPSLLSGATAGTAGWFFKFAFQGTLMRVELLIFGMAFSLGAYVLVLLVGMRQKDLYTSLLGQLFQGARPHTAEL